MCCLYNRCSTKLSFVSGLCLNSKDQGLLQAVSTQLQEKERYYHHLSIFFSCNVPAGFLLYVFVDWTEGKTDYRAPIRLINQDKNEYNTPKY